MGELNRTEQNMEWNWISWDNIERRRKLLPIGANSYFCLLLRFLLIRIVLLSLFLFPCLSFYVNPSLPLQNYFVPLLYRFVSFYWKCPNGNQQCRRISTEMLKKQVQVTRFPRKSKDNLHGLTCRQINEKPREGKTAREKTEIESKPSRTHDDVSIFGFCIFLILQHFIRLLLYVIGSEIDGIFTGKVKHRQIYLRKTNKMEHNEIFRLLK